MNISLPGYTAGVDAYKSIESIVSPYGSKITILGGETALNKAMPKLKESLKNFTILDSIIYGTEATLQKVDKLLEYDAVKDCDVIFAVGGGKAMDTIKCLSTKASKPIFTFPTLASNCASVTRVCVMHNEDGTFDRLFFMDSPVKHVFIDEEIITNSPYKYFHAGVGDTLCKGYEPVFKSRGLPLSYEDEVAINLCTKLKESIFNNAPKALEFFSNNEETHKLILDIIITTGYISYLLNDSFNCGIAHSLAYAMANVFGFEKLNLHGDAVAFGLLVNLIVEKSNEVYKVFDFLKENNYPVKLIDLKLKADNLNFISSETLLQPDMLDYPKLLSAHDIARAIILLEEDFLLEEK